MSPRKRMPDEIELTLAIAAADPAAVADAVANLAVIGNYRVVPRPDRRLADSWWDFPNGGCRARDAAVRLRRHGDRVHLAFKGPARLETSGAQKRAEIEDEWSPGALARVLEAAARLVGEERPATATATGPEEALAAAGLVRVLSFSTRRRVRDLLPPGTPAGAPAAELVVDTTAYQTSGRTLWHREIEIEAKSAAGATAIRQVSGALRRGFGEVLREWPYNKLATGIALGRLAPQLQESGMLSAQGDLTPSAYDTIRSSMERAEGAPRSIRGARAGQDAPPSIKRPSA